jgi:hypothetical protein
VQRSTKAFAPADGMHYIVGRDGSDHWVVMETQGLCGGLFADQATALRFTRDESRGRPFDVEIARNRLDFRIPGH